jgi:1,5-anhydro-D-fructose reductase (1,5-anhydro-D-mannitol-forming)
MSLGWAMVGTGSHVRDRMAPAAQHASNTRLVAVCSRNLSRAQDYAREFGFERAYADYSTLLRDKQVDVVYLATPNHLHEKQTIEAARAGKHVLVEKPMALTTEQAQAMVEACRNEDVKLGVGFHLRHHPANLEIRELLQNGSIGKPVMIQLQWVKSNPLRDGWWRDPSKVGAYVTMARGVHLIDLLMFLTGDEPVELMAMTDGQREDRPLEETAVALLRYPDDVFACLTASRLFKGAENSLEIFATEGHIRAIGTLGTDPTGSIEISALNGVQRVAYSPRDPYQAEIEAFNVSISDNTEPNASGVDGMNVVRITEALLKSARTHSAIALRSLRT